ncbi:MAG TPA: cytochrome c peroxidase [Flavobacteriales bacterium]
MLLSACRKDPAMEALGEVEPPFVRVLPPGAPEPPDADTDPLTWSKVKLGKALFFDERMSMGHGLSCASCHHPERAFSDTVAFSAGANGAVGVRNAPTLGNVAYHPRFNRDGGIPTLHQQVLVPVTDVLEMDADIHAVALALRNQEPYRTLSHKAYGRELDLFVITRAIAAYERILISGWSRFDRYLQGDAMALTPMEIAGHGVFIDAGCTACHGGFDLSDHDFHNVGLALDHADDPGRQRITLDPDDRGKFKTPTLRNVALTAPYMHDGSIATLEEVVDHFNSGGLPDPNKSPLMQPLGLTGQQRDQLLAFLRSLTDERSLDPLP